MQLTVDAQRHLVEVSLERRTRESRPTFRCRAVSIVWRRPASDVEVKMDEQLKAMYTCHSNNPL